MFANLVGIDDNTVLLFFAMTSGLLASVLSLAHHVAYVVFLGPSYSSRRRKSISELLALESCARRISHRVVEEQQLKDRSLVLFLLPPHLAVHLRGYNIRQGIYSPVWT
jgi:hypothetical protein